jgi:hypothetical protein
MGQIDSALTCYQKSALLIERDPIRENILHQAYVRMWIAELLQAREQFEIAYAFFRAAHVRWELVSTLEASKARARYEQIEAKFPNYGRMQSATIERLSRDWILGRSFDARG